MDAVTLAQSASTIRALRYRAERSNQEGLVLQSGSLKGFAVFWVAAVYKALREQAPYLSPPPTGTDLHLEPAPKLLQAHPADPLETIPGRCLPSQDLRGASLESCLSCLSPTKPT